MRVVTAARRGFSLNRSAVDPKQRRHSRLETLGLAAGTLVVVFGVFIAYRQQVAESPSIYDDLSRGRVVNLNRVGDPAELAAILRVFPSPVERRAAADAILRRVRDNGPLRRVGALSDVTVPAPTVRSDRRLTVLNERLRLTPNVAVVRLFTSADLAEVRPLFVVRSPSEFGRQVFVAVCLLMAAFWSSHGVRRAFGRTGDPVLLPVVLLLTGLSLITMVSLRDPFRDADIASSVAAGVGIGAVVLTVIGFIDFDRMLPRLSALVPFSGAATLAIALWVFGYGPSGSGVKVNLLGMQPVEPIRLLAVFALAAYFGRRWEFLRELSDAKGASPLIRRYLRLPRWQDVRPLLVIVITLLVFFFLQHDLGPALVLGCMSLALYGVARGRIPLVLAGFAFLLSGFVVGYLLGVPATLARRVAIWIDPWTNALPGGDQVAHAIWAMSSGSVPGVGLGAGDGRLIPAAHTDLIVAAIGEEMGFVGLVVIASLYVLLIWRMLRIAGRAPSDYSAFLGLGCALSLAVPAIVVVGGLMGVMPLSGVVTPFLSYGKSAMICNFAAIAISLSISRRADSTRTQFERPVRIVGSALLAAVVLLVGRSAIVQAISADDFALRPSLVRQADGTVRYQYNPRLLLAARSIPRGTILDRNGFALATDDPARAQPFAKRLSSLGFSGDDTCSSGNARCYPLGGRGFHVIGESVRSTNWAAKNSSFVERDSNDVLQGFDDHAQSVEVHLPDGTSAVVRTHDYRALLPLMRHRNQPGTLQEFLKKPRDVQVTLDGPFQALVARALESRVRSSGAARGAVVVLDPATGNLLAAASYPWPTLSSVSGRMETPPAASLLDRARYGLYPPGSTFKLVTAAAALNSGSTGAETAFFCERLADGRVGARLPGLTRPIRDDIMDHQPHGRVDLRKGLVVSCNAYFAQLASKVGAGPLADVSLRAQIQIASPPTAANLARTLPFAGYGQGEVIASPMRMARLVGAIATDGVIREPAMVQLPKAEVLAQRWISSESALWLRGAMRQAVTVGTGRTLAAHPVAIAGKTGTAEVSNAGSHSWFVGFAPYGAESQRIAFAVIIENAGYGGRVAAPLAGDIVSAAKLLGLIR